MFDLYSPRSWRVDNAILALGAGGRSKFIQQMVNINCVEDSVSSNEKLAMG